MKRLAVFLLLLALAVAMCGCRIYIAPGLALRIEFETAGQEAAAPNEDAGDEAATQSTRAPGTNGTSSSGATRTPDATVAPDATAAPSPTQARQSVTEPAEPSREQDVFEGEIYDIP